MNYRPYINQYANDSKVLEHKMKLAMIKLFIILFLSVSVTNNNTIFPFLKYNSWSNKFRVINMNGKKKNRAL